jgi:hypothetical protein
VIIMILRLALTSGIYIWARPRLRYPVLGAAGAFVAFGMFTDHQAKANAGPLGYRRTVYFTQGHEGFVMSRGSYEPPEGERVSISTNQLRRQDVASAFNISLNPSNQNSRQYLQNIDNFENGHRYATGDELISALDGIR